MQYKAPPPADVPLTFISPCHEEGVHSIDLRNDSVDDGLTVDGTRVEQDVQQGVIDEAPQLWNASKGQRLQTFVCAGVFTVQSSMPVDG